MERNDRKGCTTDYSDEEHQVLTNNDGQKVVFLSSQYDDGRFKGIAFMYPKQTRSSLHSREMH